MAPVRGNRGKNKAALTAPHGYGTHHVEFIQRFTQQEARDRTVKRNRPQPLTAQQRAALRTQVTRKRFFKPRRAKATEINTTGILRKWKRYCDFCELGAWEDVIKKAGVSTATDFIDWICDNYNIKSEGSSWEYFRQYQQLYTDTNGKYMDRNESRAIKNFHDTVTAVRFGLRKPNINGKPVASVDTLLCLLIYNIAYDTAVVPNEGHRVQLAGCYIFLATTGVRPAEIVHNDPSKPKDGTWEELYGRKAIRQEPEDGDDEAPDEHSTLLEDLLCQETLGRGRSKALCYEDILLMVVRHPETGKDVHAMAVKFIHHKGADNKPKPTIFFFTMARRVILCPIMVVISQAVRDNAFEARNLTSVARVLQTKNLAPAKCTPIRWKDGMDKIPLFRRYEGALLSPNKPLPYHTLRDDMGRQSLDAGEETAVTPKNWRRMVANAVNGSAPDAVRDQAMRHDPKWATFNAAYINEMLEYHVQNAATDVPTEDGLIKFWSHMGLMSDPRASSDMVPDEVWQEMPPDPEIEDLERRRAELKGGQFRIRGHDNEKEIRDLGRQIRNKEGKRRKDVKTGYRRYYFKNRPTWDIERQFSGEAEDEEAEVEYVAPAIELHIPERAELAEILVNQPECLDDEKLLRLRIRSAELMTALNYKRETAKRRPIRRRILQRVQAGISVTGESPGPDPFPLLMGKTQCPRCIGDERQSHEERMFPYCRPAVMNDHFDREHLKEMEEMERDNLIFCDHPKCQEDGVKLKHLDHFRNHVQDVHGITLRPKRSR
ncbi:FluG domain-containing protein [Bombardia bombarda]|uniref:FluG domain-containing protein n=1 Tax=Bombardia bombarda TaxID=252184 RepID=A0AA39XQB3_9PEZI|nr:FluG domain-containing protein [Bombardia bombarda]